MSLHVDGFSFFLNWTEDVEEVLHRPIIRWLKVSLEMGAASHLLRLIQLLRHFRGEVADHGLFRPSM